MFNLIQVAISLCAFGAGIVNVAAASAAPAAPDVNVLADFTGAKWIWTPASTDNGNYPPGNATFRRDYYPSSGRDPLSANILITTDDAYTLFVNGVKIGTGTPWTQAQRYCVPLEPDCNVFAIEGQNIPDATAAGALAAIQIRYTDGFTETVVTDTEWHGIAGPAPAGFEQVAFDDSDWPAAFVQAAWPAGIWGNQVAIPPATSSNLGPDLTSATWIWTNEVTGGDAPVGARAFRKTVALPAGQVADTITMDINTDDEFTLYINGLVVGSATDLASHRYQVNFIPSNTVTIAVVGMNNVGAAGLLVSGAISGCVCGCGANAVVNTDSSWKFSTTIPTGFIEPGFDDSAWPAAVGEGAYGVAPWGQVAIPTTNSPQSGPISGAPSAPPASVVA